MPTIKKTVSLILVLLLILILGTQTYKMIANQKGLPIDDQSTSTTTSPSPTNILPTPIGELSAILYSKNTFNEAGYTIHLKTTGDTQLITDIVDRSEWTIKNDSMVLSISTYIDGSPFSSDKNLEIEKLPDTNLHTPIYRIPLNDNQYFYSDDYRDDCGNRHCSNGLVSLSNTESLSILCEASEVEDLEVCDELVKNLKVVEMRSLE